MVFITPLAAGGAALLGLQSWATSLYTFNRDAFMIDIQVRQQNDYQKQNTKLSRVASIRQEVRDLMKQDIQKIGASILVTTLLLGLAGEMLFEGQIPSKSPPFLLNVYILCLGSGMLFMALSILFGICASYEAYESGTRLLTKTIRIKDWNKAILKHREDLESKQLTQAFEKRPFGKILALPLAARISKVWAAFRGLLRPDRPERPQPSREISVSSGPDGFEMSDLSSVCPTATEEDEVVDDESWREEWKRDIELWMPLKHCMFSCVALGTRCLLEACGYWCLGSKYGLGGGAWAYWAVSIIFIALNVLIARFYLGILIDLRGKRRRALLESRSRALLEGRISGADSGADEGADFFACRLTDLIPVVCRNHVPACWKTPLVQIAIEEPVKGGIVRNLKIWALSLVPAGAPVLLTVSATSSWRVPAGAPCLAGLSVNSILVPAGYLYHAAVTAGVGTLIHNHFSGSGLGLGHGCGPEAFCSALGSASSADKCPRGLFCGETEESSGSHGPENPSEREGSSGELCTARDMPKTMLSFSSVMLGMLWFGAFVWACITAGKVNEFNRLHYQWLDNSVTLSGVLWDGRSRVKLADNSIRNTSPYFFPHAVACPEGQKVFMANKYQVFELLVSTQTLHQLECTVDSPIKDVAVQCNKGRCFPVVLITEGSQNYLVECGPLQQKRWPLLQTHVPVSHIALRANNGSAEGWRDGAVNDLIAVVEEEPAPQVRQYTFSPLHRPAGFYPWGGPLLVLKEDVTLHSIDLVEAETGNWSHDMLMLFQSSDEITTLEIQDISNGVNCGRWTIPDLDGLGPEQVVGGGCAYSAGSSMSVLFGPGSVASKLANLSLPLERSVEGMCLAEEQDLQRRLSTRRPDTCRRRPSSRGCARAR